MNTTLKQVVEEVESPKVELLVVPDPEKTVIWELEADGIYRYLPNGNLYYRPLLCQCGLFKIG